MPKKKEDRHTCVMRDARKAGSGFDVYCVRLTACCTSKICLVSVLVVRVPCMIRDHTASFRLCITCRLLPCFVFCFVYIVCMFVCLFCFVFVSFVFARSAASSRSRMTWFGERFLWTGCCAAMSGSGRPKSPFAPCSGQRVFREPLLLLVLLLRLLLLVLMPAAAAAAASAVAAWCRCGCCRYCCCCLLLSSATGVVAASACCCCCFCRYCHFAASAATATFATAAAATTAVASCSPLGSPVQLYHGTW